LQAGSYTPVFTGCLEFVFFDIGLGDIGGEGIQLSEHGVDTRLDELTRFYRIYIERVQFLEQGSEYIQILGDLEIGIYRPGLNEKSQQAGGQDAGEESPGHGTESASFPMVRLGFWLIHSQK